MNIFWLDSDPRKLARAHADKHVVKMILETAQLMSTAVRSQGIDAGYQPTHTNHPCSVWARASIENYNLLRDIAYHLNDEYLWRWHKKDNHKSFNMLCNLPVPPLPKRGLTAPPLCMPDPYKRSYDIVGSYRNYYANSKQHLHHWTRREPPEWLDDYIEHGARP